MSVISVNGRFLGRPVTGVERFGRMILDQVHGRIAAGTLPEDIWEILLPPSVPEQPQWPGFRQRRVGRLDGHAWEQASLGRVARTGPLLNLCNSGPVLGGPSLTVIHDAAVYDLPENFSRPYRAVHRTLGRLLARRSTIATVSQFSRDRLAAILKLDPRAIAVVPNAADHIDAIVPDPAMLARHSLQPGRFLLFVGSFAPNKNLALALQAFSQVARPGERFVVVGAPVRSFAANGLPDVTEGVVLPGRIDDAALMALYGAARALVFPSLYEGFGIPPIEAMRFGCPVIAADIPPLREVCGAAAVYHEPRSIDGLAVAMRTMLDDDAEHARLADLTKARANLFSWSRSADALLDALRPLR